MADRINGRFAPGCSGNPSGRAKGSSVVVELARKYTAEAIATLADIMANGDLRSRVAAAQVLLDRAWGKPKDTVELSGPDGGPIETLAVDAPPQESFSEWAARKQAETGINYGILVTAARTADGRDEGDLVQ